MSDRSAAWHQSTLDMINNCSWKYFLRYVCGLPDSAGRAAEIGTKAHALIELHERKRIDGITVSLEDLLSELEDAEDADEAAAVTHAVSNWYLSRMKDKDVSHREWLLTMKPVGIEEYFNYPLVDGTMPIGGTIDGIYIDSNGIYHIVDYKTAKDLSRWKKDGEGKRHQATMYSVAVQLKYQLSYLPDVTYTVARTNGSGETARRVTVQPDLSDVALLGQRIRDAQQIVDAEQYVRNPAWFFCSKEWCSFYEGCMVTGELCGTPVTIQKLLASQDAGKREDNIHASTTDQGGQQ